jgi:cytochrome c2
LRIARGAIGNALTNREGSLLMISRFALAASLVLALGACGSPADEADEPTGAVAEPAALETAAPDEALPEAEATETPAAEPTATPSPTPTSTPTPSPTPTAAATAAAASPPASFAQCAVCHKTEPGETGIGPTLAGVFGAEAGHIAGFKYSQAMLDSGLTWNQATLDRYLADPKAVVPGTTMAFGGVKDAAKRQAIIDYLKTL